MANAYSILHNYQDELYTPNFGLIGQALLFKQNAVNAGRQKLESIRDSLPILDIAKEQDKEYLDRRLQTATGIVNQYANGDLSDPSLINGLVGKLTEVVDDNVKNAVLSTRRMRSEDQMIAKKMEDNPELIDERNLALFQEGRSGWLNDGQVGTKYGGSTYTDYDNYEKRLQDNISTIAKDLGAEYIESASGIGIFRDIVTKKEVSRDRVNAALDGYIGSKGKKQIAIEAWYEGKGRGEESIQAEYENWTASQLQEANLYTQNLRDLVNKTEKGSEENRVYQEQLETWERKVNDIQANSFDNASQKYGIGGIQNVLYENRVKKPWLDAYSYLPIETKREVDQNHVKTLEFQEKVREFEITSDLAERKFQLTVQKEVNKMATESGGKNTDGTPSNVIQYDKDGNPTVINTGKSRVETPEGEQSNQAFMNNQYYKATMDAQSVLGAYKPEELIEISKQISDEKLTGDELVINYRGKTKKINLNQVDKDGKSNREKLLNYYGNVIEDSPEIKVATEALQRGVEIIRDDIVEEYKKNPSIIDSFHNFDKKIIKKGDSFVIGDVEVTDNMNYYGSLIDKASKGRLTEIEEMNLGMYTAQHIMMDPKVSKGTKERIYRTLRKDLINKGLGAEYIQDLSRLTTLSQIIVDKGFDANSGTYISSIGESRMGGMIKSINKPMSEVMQRFDTNVNSVFTEAYNKPTNSPEVDEYSILPTDSRYKTLKGLIEGGANIDGTSAIKISKEVTPQGKETGKVNYEYTDKDGKVHSTNPGERSEVNPLTVKLEDSVTDRLNFQFKPVERSPYDAVLYGKDATPVKLGTSKIDNITSKRIFDQTGQTTFLTKEESVNMMKAVSSDTDRQAIQKEINDYSNGAFTYKMEVNEEGGPYYLNMYKGKDIVWSEEQPARLTLSEMDRNIRDFVPVAKKNMFKNYINYTYYQKASSGAYEELLKESQNFTVE